MNALALYAGGEARLRSWRGSRAGRALYALYEGTWLGAFGRDHLHAVTRAFYAREGERYVDEVYNASGLTPWEAAAIDRSFGACASVLVTSSGGGREVHALATRGLRVTGCECTPELAAWSRRFLEARGLAATVLDAEPDDIPAGLGPYDGIVVGWGSYMHVPGRAARIAFLRKLRGAIAEGGPLLLSFKDRKRTGRERRLVAAVAGIVRRLTGREPAEVGDELKGWYRHSFTRDEISAELLESGFVLDFYAGEPYGHAIGIAV